MAPILVLDSVWYKYPGARDYAVKDASLVVEEGRLYTVMGPNGAGKSTLLLVMAGLLEPEKGMVLFRGRPLSQQLPWARRHIGILFQNPEHMLFNPVVYDEVAYVPRQLYEREAEVEKVVEATAGMLGFGRELLARPTHMLSFGEKKLVALASILSYKPQLLLLDEPYSGLSSTTAARVARIVAEHVENGGSAVVVCHRCPRIERVPVERLYMKSGRLQTAGRNS